eukprot:TRINITY_DN576_c0_g1_i10.p1 TRINITY_DN576_c0_g1~~TRINITY_DN576_c0_g1_i10.p1  ORF type:complete len:219 (-),score=66.84 TRINITY_DN576_c0_g1_i10:392-1048(-)
MLRSLVGSEMCIRDRKMASQVESLGLGSAQELWDRFDVDHNGILDHKELQKLIVYCLENKASMDEEKEERQEVLDDFRTGSREYCLLSLKLISEDGKVTFAKFEEWLHDPENFLFYPLKKFKVMLWALDLFCEFDVDGDGWVTEEEFNMSMSRLEKDLTYGTEDESSRILGELNFADYDCLESDNSVSTLELVTVIVNMWERMYSALFEAADDFFGNL